jgi:hypothetical protein
MDIKEYRIRQAQARHPWETARFAVVWDLLRRYIGGGKIHSVYDIGCGDAYVVSRLQRKLPHESCSINRKPLSTKITMKPTMKNPLVSICIPAIMRLRTLATPST